jgi:23S rRNA (cytidine1920-2'-O)/16S rRNA (cytidine1409-2'-O)-methyltransferase
VLDLSFISLRHVLPAIWPLVAPGGRLIALVKPQFEAGRADVGKGGVVRAPDVRRRVLDEVSAEVPEWGARLEAVVESGLPGPKGNREFFLYVTAAD